MSEVAERNRRIKKLLGEKYGADKVSVRGSRGTAYGWVDVDLEIAPESVEAMTALHDEVRQLIKDAGIKLHTHYGDDDSMPRDNIIIRSRRDKITAASVAAREGRT